MDVSLSPRREGINLLHAPLDTSMRMAGLLLAGGDSRRLGRPKQLLAYRGGTILDHAVTEIEAVAELDPVVIVLPPDPSIVPKPAVRRAHIIRRGPDGGCSGSLHVGLDALPSDIQAIVILPMDQVDLTRDLIRLAVRSWMTAQPPAQILSYRGHTGHPFIFAHPLRARLGSVHGDKGMWRLLDELGSTVAHVEVDRPVPEDIDTWEDYERISARP